MRNDLHNAQEDELTMAWQDELDDDSTLWRYINFTQFVSVLERNAVWFSRADNFQDPFEGSLSQKSVDFRRNAAYRAFMVRHDLDPVQSRDSAAKISEHFAKVTKILKYLTYINCWHANTHESMAMWDTYEGKDLAIRSTLGNVDEAFTTTEYSIIGCPVEYLDFEEEGTPLPLHGADEDPRQSISHYCVKRKSFEHEKEYRLIIQNRELPFDDEKDSVDPEEVAKETSSGLYVDVSVEDLISAVYVSPNKAGWFRELVEMVVDTHGHEIDVHQSTLGRDPLY